MINLQKWVKEKSNYRLCYIEDNFAYFTNLPLDKQWGDDWDDRCYSDNAGEPYYDTDNQIIKIAFDGYLLERPCEYVYGRYSVEEINSNAVAWLTGYKEESGTISILAGTNIEDFIEKD